MKLIILAIVLAVSASGECAVFTVNTKSNAGPGSLRQAILDARAAGGGTITFTGVTGSIILQSSLPELGTKTIILGPGAEQLSLSATAPLLTNAAASTAYLSGLKLTATNGVVRNLGTLTLSECIVADGYSTQVDGVGIYNSGTLLLRNSTISGHRLAGMGNGAGVYNSGSMQLHSCTISNNAGGPSTAGAGIYNTGHAALENCTVVDNLARYNHGGGIHNAGTMELNNCLLVSNRVAFAGGAAIYNSGTVALNTCRLEANRFSGGGNGDGLYNDLAGTALVINCSIANNRSMSGGGIWNAGWLEVISTTISANQAEYSGGPIPGGGIYNEVDGSVLLENTTISGNSSLNLGGGIMNFGMLVALSSTIVSNVAYPSDSPAQAGGGIWNSGTVEIRNTLVAGNQAGNGAGQDVYGTIISDGYNLISDTNGCIITAISAGNILGVDPRLGPLQDNAGPTWTHALFCGSPAIDAGTTYGAPATDQRGVPRPQRLGVDIGAFELEPTPPKFLTVSVQNSTNLLLQACTMPGVTYSLEVSTNLILWLQVTNFTAGTTSLWESTQPGLQLYPERFYRLRAMVP